jgi:hypothetical protein
MESQGTKGVDLRPSCLSKIEIQEAKMKKVIACLPICSLGVLLSTESVSAKARSSGPNVRLEL